MTWDRRVPFDQHGNLLTCGHDSADWRPMHTFTAVLTFQRFRFRWALFVDEHRHKYPMSMQDFERIVPALMDGWVSGEWTFKKRGVNFFVVAVGR